MPGTSSAKLFPGALVKVEIIKDRGERVTELVPTDGNGVGTPLVKATFDVYKEQRIEYIANINLN